MSSAQSARFKRPRASARAMCVRRDVSDPCSDSASASHVHWVKQTPYSTRRSATTAVIVLSLLIRHPVDCASSAPGFFQNERGMSECKQCPPGTCPSPCWLVTTHKVVPFAGRFTTGSGRFDCDACGEGTYQDEYGQLTCKQWYYHMSTCEFSNPGSIYVVLWAGTPATAAVPPASLAVCF